MVHILELPEDIILHIFSFYLASETQNNFYLRISKVCKRWNNICKDRMFWKKFDGSLSEDHLHKLCQSGCLIKTEEFVYSFLKVLKCTQKLEDIFKCLPNIKSIDFSKVRLLDESIFTYVSKYCKHLSAIKFSQEDYCSELTNLGYSTNKQKDVTFQNYKVSPKLLNYYLEIQGQNLTVIDISHSQISFFTILVTLIAKCCHNLEKLFIENIKHAGKSSFPVDIIQQNCCKLKDLRLGFPVTFTKHPLDTLPGFPLLETFTHPNTEESSFTDKDLRNILYKSENLKILDIRGCRFISLNGLLSLPATHLEHLYLSGTELHGSHFTLNEILRKWMKSIRTLDVSRTSSDSVNQVLSSLVSNGRMIQLESLDLSNTRVKEETIYLILENCIKLRSLNLTSCRSMGRGLNLKYLGRTEIKKLLITLQCKNDH